LFARRDALMVSGSDTRKDDQSTDEAARAREAARMRTASDFRVAPPPRISTSSGYMVKLLKILLPLLAAALIVTMIVYSLLYKPDGSISITYSNIGNEQGDIVMKSPRFVGADKDNQPFEVIARQARQNPDDRALIELDDVQASFVLTEGPSLKLSAVKGVLDTNNQLLLLTGPLELASSDGYLVKTGEARADLKNGLLSGQTPIEASGAFGTIRADGFEANKDARTVNFKGNVRVHFIPHGGQTG
jgi:lipopolysaccharide export system protein LptC